MNDNLKTGIYLGVALVVLLVAIAVWPRTQSVVEAELVGQPLFPDYENPSVARKMKIVVPDSNTGQFEEFTIDRRNNLWVVPSHGNYPVDSPERLQQAALALVDLEVLGIASEEVKDHARYGVLDPDNSDDNPAVSGMGTKVELSDSQGTPLAELIIGHAQEGKESTRFVRIPGRDTIYAVTLSIDPFVTRFQDWIDSDLLGVSEQQISGFLVYDYLGSVERREVEPRFKLQAVALPQPPAAPQQPPQPRQWEVEEFLEVKDGAFTQSELLEGEVLNAEAISTMLQTVAQLQIVDVVRKPTAMAAQLQKSEFFTSTDFAPDLLQYGFLPTWVSEDDHRVMFYGSNGEVVISTDAGVEYKLCFGRPLSGEEGSTASDLRRYMMVVARLNPLLMTPPTILPEPTPPTAAPVEETPAEGEAGTEDTAAAEEPVQPAPLSGDDVLEGPPEGVSQEAWDAYMDELLQIRQINQSILNGYQVQLREADDRVLELNTRFADWFYVISESEYDRMHLSRTELFTAGAGGMGIEEFNDFRDLPLERGPEVLVPEAP